VYFRANTPGACDYVNDSRYWRYSHGTCWSEVADDLLVVDVPGDHFSLLRQVQHSCLYQAAYLRINL
jgi:hypothetical protein